ncbi:MAG: hypothetical protein ACW99Q_20640 [Candidatus Kariarchaeaceae archaeon]|jgi:hypothetical protein
MIIRIKDVQIGPEEELIDYTILGQLKTGKIIEVHGNPDQDLRELIGQEINCLLLANRIMLESDLNLHSVVTKVFDCKYIGNYEISEEWKGRISEYYIFKNAKFYAMEIDDGFFIGSRETFPHKNLRFGGNQINRFWIPSFGLIAWYPDE